MESSSLDAIMRRAQECAVEVEIEALVVAGRRLTVVTVPEMADRIVATSDGRVLRRVGSDNVPLCGAELARLLRHHHRRLPRILGRLPSGDRPGSAGAQ